MDVLLLCSIIFMYVYVYSYMSYYLRIIRLTQARIIRVSMGILESKPVTSLFSYIGGGTRGGAGRHCPPPTFKETCNIGHGNLMDKPYSTQYNHRYYGITVKRPHE